MANAKRMVVGIDFTDASRIAMEHAYGLVTSEDDVLDIVVVLESPGRATADELAKLDNAMEHSMAEATAFTEALRVDGAPIPKICMHVVVGKPAETLLQIAVDHDADFVIVGTHARKGLERWALGSVAETLVRNARLPVIVAKKKDFSGLQKTDRPDAAIPGADLHHSRPRTQWLTAPKRNSHVAGLV
jgi:nucleotide-binding universal stress UspA family protein